jgi:hypothetical protein
MVTSGGVHSASDLWRRASPVADPQRSSSDDAAATTKARQREATMATNPTPTEDHKKLPATDDRPLPHKVKKPKPRKVQKRQPRRR